MSGDCRISNEKGGKFSLLKNKGKEIKFSNNNQKFTNEAIVEHLDFSRYEVYRNIKKGIRNIKN